MKKLFKQASKIIALFVGLLFLGCSGDDNGGELPKVVAGFTFTLNADTGTATFKNTSTNATAYAWDFGDGNNSTEASPIKNFASGTFTVSLKASNAAGASDTFEDDITVELPQAGAMVMLPITFDDAAVDYTVTAFEGVAFTIVDNPDVSGTNDKASKVGSIVNSGVAFEGFYFDLGTDVDLTTNKTISMNFWSDAAVDLLVKLEEGTADPIEVSASHGGTGWETILFDFSSSESYSRFTFFANGPGTEAGTYYIDDIDQIETVGGGDATCTAETAQSLSAADFNLTFQTDPTASIGSFDAGLSWIDNPDTDNEVNSSCKVGQIDRIGSALFANNQIVLDAKLDLSANAGFKMKVWSPTAGTNVLVKLEDQADAGVFTELSVATTIDGAWEELTFPFASSESGKHDLIILFFELNTNTTETYYIDDFALYASTDVPDPGPGTGNEGNLTVNGDFETGNTSGWDVTPNNGTFEASDVEAACGTFSGHIVADIDGGTGGPSFPFAKQSNIGIGTVTPNSEITISFDLRGTLTGDGGVFIAEFFSENSTGGTSKSEILSGGPLSPTDTWTRYTYTVTTGDDVSGGVSLLMKSECGPVAGCSVDAYFDNVFVGMGTTGGDNCGGTTGGTGGTGGTGTGQEFTTNGDLETGDTSGWTLFTDAVGASFTASSAQASGGTFSGNLVADFEAGNGGAVDAVIKQANLGIGTVTPNTDYVVSFDLRGSSGEGGDFFVEFFSELPTEGVSKAEIITGGPITPTPSWTSYSFTVTTGPDVGGGITLQLKSSCGPVAGCVVDAFIDNVSVKLAE
ncbi:carbohydrate binding domain-containing protein [Maribacter sp.]|nr:carbohydrate binding domain-containing protein [Maribacter sp.]